MCLCKPNRNRFNRRQILWSFFEIEAVYIPTTTTCLTKMMLPFCHNGKLQIRKQVKQIINKWRIVSMMIQQSSMVHILLFEISINLDPYQFVLVIAQRLLHGMWSAQHPLNVILIKIFITIYFSIFYCIFASQTVLSFICCQNRNYDRNICIATDWWEILFICISDAYQC